MAGILDELGITETTRDGTKTKLRGITAPEAGDEYRDSYYRLLEAIEKNTVYFRDDPENLPIPGAAYDTLIGIAPSSKEHLDGHTVHLYDSESGTWIDTFAPLNSLIEDIESRVSDVSDHVDLGDNYDSLEELITAIETNAEDITALEETAESIATVRSELETQISDLEDDADAALRNAVGDRYVDTEQTVSDDIDEIEAFINDLHGEICGTTVEIEGIETWPANNREHDYSIIFDIGYGSVGETVYMEAESGWFDAEWSATLETNTADQWVSQDGNVDVRHDEPITITLYPDRRKEEVVYQGTYNDHTG